MLKTPIGHLLTRLWQHISLKRRRQFALLLVMMILASFTEIVSLGAVIPFLGVLTAPERVFSYPHLRPLFEVFGLNDSTQILFPVTLIFACSIVFSAVLRVILLWSIARLSFAVGADLGISIYRRTLYQPYEVHLSRNSSEVISGISGKANGVIYSIVLPIMTLISSTLIMVAILLTLLAIEPSIAISSFAFFAAIYFLITRITRKKLISDSECMARDSVQVIKALQEGLGGIRDVLINGSQSAFCDIYQRADAPLRRAQGNSVFISNCPRYIIEAFGMLLIVCFAYMLVSQDGVDSAIPVLGALALGAQRMLPVLQQTYSSWATIQGGQSSLQDVVALLDQPLPEQADDSTNEPLAFEKSITLNQVSFGYSCDEPYLLNCLDLALPKGSRVGFIGATGSGKSTLLDIIMGLLKPSEGSLQVDGKNVSFSNNRAWQSHIAHVPQAIFLADSSVEENIAFGVPKEWIDHQRVRQAAQQAQIAESIEKWPMGYQTFVGERGIRLSGGQRQRIGIARALYKRADVIIFDEATSALDGETEQAVMNSISGLGRDLTILIIAHRLTTLKGCDFIVEMASGSIKRIGVYEDIVNHSFLENR